jgi:hypothetical protein
MVVTLPSWGIAAANWGDPTIVVVALAAGGMTFTPFLAAACMPKAVREMFSEGH